MTNYVASDFDKIYLANGESLNIVGLGDVRIKQQNGFVCTESQAYSRVEEELDFCWTA